MEKGFRAAIIAVTFLFVLLLMAAAFFRYIVPSILEAHFTGSLFVASVAGLGGVITLAILAMWMARYVASMLRDDKRESNDER